MPPFFPFRLGVVQFMAFPESLHDPEEFLSTLKAIGRDETFSIVEIAPPPDAKTLQSARAILNAAHLDCIVAATPLILRRSLNPSSTTETVRRDAVSALRDCLKGAAMLRAKGFVLMSGPYGGREREELEALTRTLDELCSLAAELSDEDPIFVLIEPFDRTIDKKALIGPSRLAAELWGKMKSRHQNFGFLVDLSHLPLLNETPQECLMLLGEAVCHTHLGNCVLDPEDPLYGDQHPPFGYGVNDVPEVRSFLESLRDTGYFTRPSPFGFPTLSFEIKPLPDQDPFLVLANAKRVLSLALKGRPL